jgi:hypothetical protein
VTPEDPVVETDLWEQHAGWWQEGFTDGADPGYEEQILPLARRMAPGPTGYSTWGPARGSWLGWR